VSARLLVALLLLVTACSVDASPAPPPIVAIDPALVGGSAVDDL
jgi:hypothetical protein